MEGEEEVEVERPWLWPDGAIFGFVGSFSRERYSAHRSPQVVLWQTPHRKQASTPIRSSCA